MLKTRTLRRTGLCLLTLIFLLSGLPAAQAATYNGETVYYTVVNDTLLELHYASIPIVRNGVLYIPYAVLTTHFDILSSYSAQDRVLFLSNSQKIIKFDMNRQKAFDRYGNEINQTAILAKGQVFVPAVFTAEYLELSCSLLADADIVRVKNADATYPEVFLAMYFQEQMKDMLKRLLATTTPPGPEDTTDPGATSTTPPPQPRDIWLCLTGGPGDSTAAILDTLRDAGVSAGFFVSAEALSRQSGLLCRMLTEGHGIGLAPSLSGDSEEAEAKDVKDTAAVVEEEASLDMVLDEAARANDLLFRLMRRKSRLLHLPGDAAEELITSVQSAGYQVWQESVTPEPAETPAALRGAVRTALENSRGSVVLVLPDDALTALTLSDILQYLRTNAYHLQAVSLTNSP